MMPTNPLTSPRFSGNKRLVAAAKNAPTLRKGAAGEAVRILQRALIDDKIPLPLSMKKYGSPDGGFGKETKAGVITFQQKYGLDPDGAVGRQTMSKLNELFPSWSPPPPPVVPTSYQVPGIRQVLKQPNGQTCWAVTYTMMRSWRDRQNYEVEQVLKEVMPGRQPSYLQVWNLRKGLAFYEIKTFYREAGMKFENLQSLTPEGWIEMLMSYGLLMVGTSFSATDNGNHANLVWGIMGDGTIENTGVGYIDPYVGLTLIEPFETFHRRMLDIIVVADGLNDASADALVQIAHF